MSFFQHIDIRNTGKLVKHLWVSIAFVELDVRKGIGSLLS